MKKFEKTYGNCLTVGSAISKAESHLGVVMEVVINDPVKKQDPFPWRNLSGALQGLQELRVKAPELAPRVRKIEKDLERLRSIIYKTPGQREKIHSKHSDVSNGLSELRKGIRMLCSDGIVKS